MDHVSPFDSCARSEFGSRDLMFPDWIFGSETD